MVGSGGVVRSDMRDVWLSSFLTAKLTPWARNRNPPDTARRMASLDWLVVDY